tara:strand:- start:3711 stop:5018 length:1308 start_codon:yes stop_codon:yes gene_type:complete
MAETKTSDALTKATTKTEDYGLYTQGKIKLNYDNSTNMWKQEYQTTKKPKVFIPPMPTYKAADTTTTTTTNATTATTDANVKVATPMVQQRNNDTPQERRMQEDKDRFGPGQNPMQTATRISDMFTPDSYYDSIGALKVNGNTLTVNFDAIDDKGGYGLNQSKLGKVVQPLGLLGRGMQYAEKGMMEGTINKFKNANIITSGSEIEDKKGIYNFTIDKVKYDNYINNAPVVAKALTDNRELQDKLGKLDRVEQDNFVSDMAISMAKDDDTKNAILNALQKRSNGATSAVIAAYTGEELDLNRKTIFGGDFYPDTFKAQYNSTLAELNAAKGNESPSGPPGTSSTTTSVENEERKKLIEDLDNLIKDKNRDREPNRQAKGSITGSTEGSGKAKTSGPPSRTVNTPTGATSQNNAKPKDDKTSSGLSGRGSIYTKAK